MQEVSAKWLSLHNPENKKYILPPQDITISFYGVDIDIKGYTDTTYTKSALGDVNVGGGMVNYNIYFQEPITFDSENKRRLYLFFYNDINRYMLSGAIYYYNNNNVLIDTQNIDVNATTIQLDLPVNISISRINIIVNNYNADIYLKTINIEKPFLFDSRDVTNVELSQDGDLLSFELPKSAMSFELNNENGDYNPDNPNNKLASLSEGRLVEVYITQHYDNGTKETIKGGEYFIAEWNTPQNGITATFSARDGILFMNAKNQFTQSTPMYDNRYKETSSIISDGSSFINTNIILENGVNYYIYLSFSIPDTNNKCIFGANDNTYGFSFEIENGYFVAKTNGNTLQTTIAAVANEYYMFLVSADVVVGANNTIVYQSTDIKQLEGSMIKAEYHATYWAEQGYTLGFPTVPLYLFANNNNGSANGNSNITIRNTYEIGVNEYSFSIDKYENGGFYTIVETVPAVDTEQPYPVGLYNKADNRFWDGGNGFTGGTDLNYMTLYHTAYFAFVNSNIPQNPDNTYRFDDISSVLKGYQNNADLSQLNYSYAETVQLCANAAKCVWYWDRNCQSHIVPFEMPRKLPEGYTRCERIYIPNGAYLDLGFVPSNVAIHLTYAFDAFQSSAQIIGTDNGINYNFAIKYNRQYTWGSNGQSQSGGTFSVGKKVLIFNGLQNNNVSVSNEALGQVIVLPSTSNLYIGHRGGDLALSLFNGYVYDCLAISKTDNSLLGDYVACYRDEDDEAGLYDFVTGSFISNSGSGTITHSSQSTNINYDFETDNLPNGYTQVACIDNNGIGQIDLSYIRLRDSDYEQIEFAVLSGDTDIWNNGSNTLSVASNKLMLNSDEITAQFPQNNKTIINLSHNYSIDITVSGDYSKVCTDVNAYGNSVVLIKSNGGRTIFSRYKRWTNDGDGIYLANDLVPCIRNSDDAVGVYDIIDSRFYPATDCIAGYPKDYAITQFHSYNNAEYELTDELSEVNINNGLAIYHIQGKGVVQTVDNPFITDADHAFEVAKWIGDTLKLRKSLSGEYRPDTRADIYDMATVENKYATNNIFFEHLKYTFNGGFKGEYKGKASG